MSRDTTNLDTLEPLEIVDTPEDPSTDPVRLELTIHPDPEKADSGGDLSHPRWAVDIGQSDEHFHPRIEERFEVLAGEYRVVIEETDTTLTEGDDIVLPADVPHRHWNPTGRPTRLLYEARPGLRLAEFFETGYALAQAGRTNEDGLPNLLQFAVIQSAHPGYFYTTDIPTSVQRALFATLAPIGRLAGYEATYSCDEIDDLR